MIDFTKTNKASDIGNAITSKTDELLETIDASRKSSSRKKARQISRIEREIAAESKTQVIGLGAFLNKIEKKNTTGNTDTTEGIATQLEDQEILKAIKETPSIVKQIEELDIEIIPLVVSEVDAFDPDAATKAAVKTSLTQEDINNEIQKTKDATTEEDKQITKESLEDIAKAEVKKKVKELNIVQELGELADKSRLLFDTKPLIDPSVTRSGSDVIYRYDIIATNKYKDLEPYSGRLVASDKLTKYIDKSSILFNTKKILENGKMHFVLKLKIPLSKPVRMSSKLMLKTHLFPFGPETSETEIDFLADKTEKQSFGELSDSIHFGITTVGKPEPPDVEIVSYRGNSTKLLFNFWPRYDISNYKFTNYFLKEYVVEKSLDLVRWTFEGKTALNEDTYLETDTIANIKMYYRFRSIDTVEQSSMSSPIYEVVFRENSGALFLEQKIYQEPRPEKEILVMKKRIKIEPSAIQKELSENPSGENLVLKSEIGKAAKSVWYDKPNIKIRVTSKKTRRKFDLNINFKLIAKSSIDKNSPIKEMIVEFEPENKILFQDEEQTENIINVYNLMVKD